MSDNACEAEGNKKAFPDTQSYNFMPADICLPNSTFEDDELEALVSTFFFGFAEHASRLIAMELGCPFLVRCTQITFHQWIHQEEIHLIGLHVG